ncbi:carbohydrate ABC transporter permease [Ohessyouella blattaphilus]|uniref:Carbohydrate ABC transporter permease n=1 Tax=Ohessyouella blattaphilus TaxID=2949333 RepID=A0ABT1EFY5_9FIRM|nr:carbohydrate ABC transporter permease [Ohessyouella blattaphilus]MCP1109558.1 carbohydrate ABC transporter permease [Ohessyouella blattaphilus]MCR8562952.1 carbohydrate ABC transporter permease [Ohessyouella blattaphilus]
MKIVRKVTAGIFLIFIVCISIVPFLWVLSSSFKGNAEIMSSAIGFSGGLRFDNYIKAFQMAPMVTFYKNSIIVAVLSTILNLLVFSMAAYVLVRCKFRLNGIITMLFSAALVIPGAALLQPLYQTLNTAHLYDTLTGLIIVYAALGMPTTLYIMMSYYKTISSTLEEAAYIDGAGFFQTFARIVLPLTRPAFATAGVLQFLLCWNEFQFALTLTTGTEQRTLPIALYYFKSAFASDYGAMFAATVLVTLPSIVVFVLMQKQVISGLAAGAVKE